MPAILLHSNPSSNLGWSFWIPIFISLILAAWNLFQQKKIQSLKSEIDKKLLVHRIQFETEFTTYREIWKGLANLQKVLQLLRPIVDNIPKGKTYEETIRERIPGVIDAANALITIIEGSKPFYPSIINDKLIQITKAINKEILFASSGDIEGSKIEYWLDRENRFKEINAAINDACLSIRERVGTKD